MTDIPEKAVILLSRKVDNTDEFLFIRPHKALYYQFPVAKQIGKETVKSSIRKTLKDVLQVEVQEVRKVSATGYQPPNELYTMLVLYTAYAESGPQITNYIDEFVWLNKNEALKRKAQMTNTMQDYVFPCLEENELW